MSTDDEFPCCVETALSSRSQCRKCNGTIAQGTLRIGRQYDPNHSGYRYWHPRCFPPRYRPPGSAADFFFGWEKLSPKQHEAILNALHAPEPVAVKKTSGVPKKAAAPAQTPAQTPSLMHPLSPFSSSGSADQVFQQALLRIPVSARASLSQMYASGHPVILGALEVAVFDSDMSELIHTLSLV